MHPRLNITIAQHHVADLHRAADHDRLVRAAIAGRRHSTAPPVAIVRRLRRRLTRPRPAAR